MLRNYLKIAWRNLRRNAAFSLINVTGLAVGMATCLLILLYVWDELSYDRYAEKADRIVRVVFNGQLNGKDVSLPVVAPAIGPTLQREFPEVEEVTRLRVNESPFISYGNLTFKETRFAYADANFLQVFSIPFIQGDPKTALKEPNTLVITQKTARKYFGGQNPLGKLLEVKSQKQTYRVTGVIGKIPQNSHFHFDLFASIANTPDAKELSWLSQMNFNTYLVLADGYPYQRLLPKLAQTTEKYMGPAIESFMGASLAEFRRKGNDVGLGLQPLTDIHLRSTYSHELEPGGGIGYVYMFSAMALFMLLIACINFTNLTTAAAARRAQEVGIRKVLGSERRQLIGQFLVESLLLAVFALGVGVLLVEISLPFFNHLSGKTLTLSIVNPVAWVGLLALGIWVGLLAGSYPALFLSSFLPISVLKGSGLKARSGGLLRRGLIVFQFTISVVLIIGTIVVYQQLTYVQSKKLGYEKDQVVVLHDTYLLGTKEALLKEQLRQTTMVINASVSGHVPVGPTDSNNNAFIPEDNSLKSTVISQYNIDANYMPTLGMKLVKGRNFASSRPADSSAIILNEAAVQALGWQVAPLGKRLIRPGGSPDSRKMYTVIGVVSNFHFESLHQKVGPLAMLLGNNSGNILVQAKATDMAALLTELKRQWEQLNPAAPFAYSFLSDRFAQVYRTEERVAQTLAVCTGLTILIACLGLFGLATYSAQQRTKEIGVRKVLGASVASIIALLSRDFLTLVVVSIAIAIPVAWYAASQWLANFAYRISIEWWMFVGAGLLAIGIALLTVSFQSVKAALMNPVRSLRSE